ncbi:MAG: ABC transporter permease [Fimbriimonadales bacterium]|nr:ABC transporter permease [Fimbriimonadales bacterium]
MDAWLAILMFATPISLAAIGETVGQRSGVLNIGLEGTMLAGAVCAAMVALWSGNAWLGLSAGIAAGAALSALTAFLCVSRPADQVVVGTGVNLLAMGLTGAWFRSLFGQSGKLFTVPTLPKIGGLDPIAWTVPFLALGAFVLLRRTHFGLALRASGESPKAVEASGRSVFQLRWVGLLVSGALGAAGGAHLALVVSSTFAENMTSGRGFVALAMVTFGRWNPLGAFAACLLIGYLESLQFSLQAAGGGLPQELLLALPYATSLLALALFGRGGRAPAALAIPYRRSG